MQSFRKELLLFGGIFIVTLGLFFSVERGIIPSPEGLWGIDNSACVGCGGCATECVLPLSAAKAQIDQSICSNREDCPAYFKKGRPLIESPENEVCPTGALIRTPLGDGTYKYSIDASKCNGCGKCTRLCQRKGDGALTLVIDTSLCVDCNECHIGLTCPTKAIHRTTTNEVR